MWLKDILWNVCQKAGIILSIKNSPRPALAWKRLSIQKISLLMNFCLILQLEQRMRFFCFVFYKKETKLMLYDGGDQARLFWPDNTLISSSEVYKDADYDISWSRNLDNSWLFITTVTPEKANIFTSKQDEIINAPVIPIEKAKKQEKNDWVKIERIVTSPPGLFGKKVMYIQR